VSSEYSYQPLAYYQSRDLMKRQLATEKGITLVVIPCWWDCKIERLVSFFYAFIFLFFSS